MDGLLSGALSSFYAPEGLSSYFFHPRKKTTIFTVTAVQ